MSPRERRLPEIDDTLLAQVAALPHGGQRWLRTALLAIATIEPVTEREEKRARRPPAREPKRPRPGPSLDELLSGEADLSEQAKAYPELAEELKGIADIADLLREAGRDRRRLGEDVLRDELLGESEEAPQDEHEDNGAG